MFERSSLPLVTPQRLLFPGLLGFLTWMALSLLLVALAALSPRLFSPPEAGLQLGDDLPLGVMEDRSGTLSVDQVAALPDTAFTWLHAPLSKGYSSSVYWLRIHSPAQGPGGTGPLWLNVMPPHLDRLTLYQRDANGWVQHTNGDNIPISQRVRTRQLLFPLLEDQPLLLRLQTTSATQVYGTVWRDSALLAELSRTEWASGMHLGISLLLTLLIGRAAMDLRSRSLTASALLSFMVLVHTANARGYPLLWLPESAAGWFDVTVRLGVFALPASFAWQGREFFTQGTAWRRLDRLMVAHTIALLLAMLSIPVGRYAQWAPFAFFSPWLTATLCSAVAWTNMYRKGVTPVRILMAVPYTLHALLGLHVAATYIGWVSPRIDADVYWQAEALLLEIMIMVAVGANLVARFQHGQRRQAQLVETLALSERALDERVRQRTAELQQTQHNLQASLASERKMRDELQALLASERKMRNEQRQFFGMVNHEFRTPLAIMDLTAAEQFEFPTLEIAEQRERAATVRRACRRMAALVDNCLVGDRLNSSAFQPQWEHTLVAELVNDAAQLALWSSRHEVHLELAHAPATWVCDPMLLGIALSNLVDNAVKYSVPGEIGITARIDESGNLRFSICDQGPGLAPEVTHHLFKRGTRGGSTQANGFGLGLWVVRRIAQLHGGEVEVTASAKGGSCFTLALPSPAFTQPKEARHVQQESDRLSDGPSDIQPAM